MEKDYFAEDFSTLQQRDYYSEDFNDDKQDSYTFEQRVAEANGNLVRASKDMGEQFALGAINATFAGIPQEVIRYYGNKMVGSNGDELVKNLESENPFARFARGVGTFTGTFNPVGLFAAGAKLGVIGTKKAIEVGAKIVVKSLPKQIQTEVLARMLADKSLKTVGTLVGAGAGASLVNAPKDLDRSAGDIIKEKAVEVATGAAYGAALGSTAGPVKNIASAIGRGIRDVAGISEASIKNAQRLGLSRVLDPLKREEGYVGNVLVPRIVKAKDDVMLDSKKLGSILKDLDVSDDTITVVRKNGFKNIEETTKRLGSSVQDLSEKLQVDIDNKLNQAGKFYDETISQIKKVYPRRLANNIKFQLKSQGLIDQRGNLTIQAQSKTISPSYRKLLAVYDELGKGSMTGGKVTGYVQGSEMRRWKDFINSGVSPNRNMADDIPLIKALESHKEDIINVNEQAKKAYSMYSLAKKSSDRFMPMLRNERGEGILNRASKGKVPSFKYNELKELERYSGIKFTDDLRKIGSYEEINNALIKEFSPKNIENSILKLSEYASTKSIDQNRVKSLYSKLLGGKDVVDDAIAKFTGDDLLQQQFATGFIGAKPGVGYALNRVISTAPAKLVNLYLGKGIPAKKKIEEAANRLSKFYGISDNNVQAINNKSNPPNRIGDALKGKGLKTAVIAGTGLSLLNKNVEASSNILRTENSKSSDVSNKGAVGVMQVTKGALADFNERFKDKKYVLSDMKDDIKAKEVGGWYYDKRIPELLRDQKIKVNEVNKVIAYNAGAAAARNYYKLPEETVNYLIKHYSPEIKGIDVNNGVDVFNKINRKDAEKMQSFLKKKGLYEGEVDNKWGPKSKEAFVKWLRSK